jgi:hypothetical protein
LLADLFFVGQSEYAALYRSAYNGPIAAWIVDVCGLDLFSLDIDSQIRQQVNKCWICPMTDSLRINAFLKTNNLISRDVRPDWLSLSRFGDVSKVRAYLGAVEVANIIILEDFIGTGNQASSILRFAGENFPEAKIAFAPLVVCPQGDQRLSDLVSQFPNISYLPQLVLLDTAMMSANPRADEPNLHTLARALFAKVQSRFQLLPHETMYGFKSTGSQVVMHSNCPNNTLQVFHHEGDDWTPLFPRVRRVL